MTTDDKTATGPLADELAIRNLIARLALLADAGDLDEYVSLFTEDASWEMPGAPRRGHADILAGASERRAGGTAGPGSGTRHVITNVAVHLDGGDTATSDCYFLFFGDTASSNPTVRIMGHYHDTFRREAAGWRLARREIAFG
jgi:3-phenylpropionate/cinnamic acid dioxygenase small subunit